MKTAIESLRNSLALVALVAALCFTMPWHGNAQNRISTYTPIFQMTSLDDFIVNSWTNGMHSTRRASLGVIKDFILGDLPTVITNTASNSYYFSTNFPNVGPQDVKDFITTNLLVDARFSNYVWTNIWSTNGLITGLYATNINGLDSYVSNYFWTNGINSPVIVASNFFATNIYAPTIVTSNFYTTNVVVQNIKGNNITVTNVYFLRAMPQETAWAGPSNAIDFAAGSLQAYRTFTPVAVTNHTGTTNGYGNSLLLCITNASSSNVTVTAPAGWKIGTGESSPWTLTNANILELWFYWSSNRATLTGRQFY